MFVIISCSEDDNIIETKPDDTKIVPLLDTVPNPSFENWKPYTIDGVVLFETPDDPWWETINKVRLLGGPVTTEKTTDAHTGQYAARLETIKYTFVIITGVLQTGSFHKGQDTAYMIEGVPFVKKPIKLRCYYKYFPVDNDSAAVYINLTKFDKAAGTKDTLAEGKTAIKDTVPEYQLLELDVTYYKDDVTPDSLNISFISSYHGSKMMGGVGSALYIDDVSIEMPSGIIIPLMYEDTKEQRISK